MLKFAAVALLFPLGILIFLTIKMFRDYFRDSITYGPTPLFFGVVFFIMSFVLIVCEITLFGIIGGVNA